MIRCTYASRSSRCADPATRLVTWTQTLMVGWRITCERACCESHADGLVGRIREQGASARVETIAVAEWNGGTRARIEGSRYSGEQT